MMKWLYVGTTAAASAFGLGMMDTASYLEHGICVPLSLRCVELLLIFSHQSLQKVGRLSSGRHSRFAAMSPGQKSLGANGLVVMHL